MTSWLRTLGATFVLGAGAVLLPVGPLGGPPGAAGVAYGAERTPPGAEESDRTRAVSRSPSASPSRSASPSASRPGSGPGEGRDRPGRDETAREESRDTRPPRRGRAEQEGTESHEAGRPDGDGVRRPDARRDASTPAEDDPAEQSPAGDSGGVTPTESGDTAAVPVPATSSPAARPDTVAGTAVEPVLRILPLGSGLILIGLGFALAFLGLRMRQERGAR
ncbi:MULTISPECIES: hypothetical protein [Streptomyces]|uniref:Uncharacterized protein n=2 Tax=Streptomyces TaxID=1883 RepID=A0AB39NMK2_9ACTN|nr:MULTISPECIES: hypothetical protein [Streptomyces]MCI4142477.1 hypothetical protein [Streptomyces sp. MMS20-AI2-20]GGS40915.1 hypothetical protein GCM10010285_20330 [Streptomyces rubiginosus]